MAKRRAVVTLGTLGLDRGSAVPLHRQLYDGLREAILSGRLRPGARLPSTRVLAGDIGASRNTVLAAFGQLLAEGYLEGRVGAGTTVAGTLPETLLRAHPEPADTGHPGRRPRLSRRGALLLGTRTRALYAERQAALVRAARRTLGGLLEVGPAEAGMRLMGWLPDGADDRVASRAALAREVDAPPLSAYRARPARRGARSGLMLGYAAYTPREIDDACARLAATLRGVVRGRPEGPRAL